MLQKKELSKNLWVEPFRQKVKQTGKTIRLDCVYMLKARKMSTELRAD
jgi:hypothetical protein